MSYNTILGVSYGTIRFSDGPWRRGGDTGCLYGVEFDSGWVKIGHTTDWPTRHDRLGADFRGQYGSRHWQSSPVSAIKQPGTWRCPLRDLEHRLEQHARRPDRVIVLSDQLPDRGRAPAAAANPERNDARSPVASSTAPGSGP